ncbi:MAG: hypothetical protein JSW27_00460, partial [Phycisphaerales bacterium]
MKRHLETACIAALLLHLSATALWSHPGPFDGTCFRGRIAFSSDGNYNDEDDWGAFPVAVAILDAFGVTDKLVHVDYCNILPKNDARFYREMVESVLGAAKRYNIPRTVLFDCQKDLDGAVESIANAINASSADDPLYYILAGPMEVPFRGIEKSDPDKRQYVYCISHNSWNDGYTGNNQDLHPHNKRDVIPSGVHWIQCRDGNRHLAHPGGVGKRSTPEQWRLYEWLRDSSDARLKWIFTRLEAELRTDISDATMTYFLLTGDEDADLFKLQRLLDEKKRPDTVTQRETIRMEAENFRALDGFEVRQGDRKASKRLSVRWRDGQTGRIATRFDEIHASTGRYDVGIRYRNAGEGACSLTLYVNGARQGASWSITHNTGAWKTHTIENVSVNEGDQIAVRARGQAGELDYVELRYRGPVSARSHSSHDGDLDDPAALP